MDTMPLLVLPIALFLSSNNCNVNFDNSELRSVFTGQECLEMRHGTTLYKMDVEYIQSHAPVDNHCVPTFIASAENL